MQKRKELGLVIYTVGQRKSLFTIPGNERAVPRLKIGAR